MDWFLILFLTLVVGLLGLLGYHQLTQSRAEQRESEIWKEQLQQTQKELLKEQTKESDASFKADHDVDAFLSPFNYVTLYEQEKAKDKTSDMTKAVLLLRACDVVKRRERIQRAVKPINDVINTMPNPGEVQEQLMSGVKAMEQEIKSVTEEADSISAGWGSNIISQAGNFTILQWRNKEMIKRQQALAQQQAQKSSSSSSSSSSDSSESHESALDGDKKTESPEQIDLLAPSTDPSDPLPYGKRFSRNLEMFAPNPPLDELLKLAPQICFPDETLKSNAIAYFRTVHDVEAFTIEYPARKEYEKAKASEKLSLDELKRELRRRAFEAVKKATRIQRALPPINQALKLGRVPEPPAMQRELQAGVDGLNAEMGDITQEANVLAPGWGNVIMMEAQKLYEATAKLEQKKAMEAKQKEEAEKKKADEQKASEQAYNELMAEEERKSKKKEKDNKETKEKETKK